MAGDTVRLNRDGILRAVTDFTALAGAYADASESDLNADRPAAEVVRHVVATLAAFAEKRRAEDDARARAAVASGLRSIYVRVRGRDSSETEAPPSRRTWHEGVWTTDEERRDAIVRMFARWAPNATSEHASAADLTPDQIEAYGGAAAAAEAVVTALWTTRKPPPPGLRGATVFGLPLAY